MDWGPKPFLSISTVPVFIDSHLRDFAPEIHADSEWSHIQLLRKTQQELVDDLIKFDIDILCLSLYCWNEENVYAVTKNIKQLLGRDILIVAGGPSVTVYRNHAYLDEHPDFDFAVYAQGEQAFLDIMRHVRGEKRLSRLESKNIAWRDEAGKFCLGDFEFIKKHTGSPYVESRHLLEQQLNDSDYNGYVLEVPYETGKGCPFKCSFCDWTSGLTHKISKRQYTWYDELKMFGELGLVKLSLADANFGLHEDDLEIARTVVELKKTYGYQFEVHRTNFSKTQKHRVFEIVELWLEHDILVRPKFAVQDTHAYILENVDRPDVPWAEHRAFLDYLSPKYPKVNFMIELIQGLPGQTRESWEETLLDIENYNSTIHPWAIIPNSPAGYDPEYRAKMKLKTVWSSYENRQNVSDDFWYKIETVVSTYSYTIQDYAYFAILTRAMLNPAAKIAPSRREYINKIKNSKNLNSCIDKIVDNIEDGREIFKIIIEFLKSLLLECRDWPKETQKQLFLFYTGNYFTSKKETTT